MTTRIIQNGEDPNALLTAETVEGLTGFKRDTFTRWAKRGTHGFPAAILVGRRNRWRAGPIHHWIATTDIKPPT